MREGTPSSSASVRPSAHKYIQSAPWPCVELELLHAHSELVRAPVLVHETLSEVRVAIAVHEICFSDVRHARRHERPLAGDLTTRVGDHQSPRFFVSSIFLCVLVMRHIRDGKWLPFQHSLFGSRVTCLRVTIGSCRSLTMNGTCGTSSGFVVFRFRVTGCAETSVVCKPSVFTHVETISAMWRVCASREMRRMDTWKCGCLSTCICACAYAPVDAFCCRTA